MLSAFLILLLSTPDAALGAQAPAVAPGQVIERVTVAQVPEQTYALYLPTTYTPQRRWPVLFALDPAARGVVPVERFRAAAEKYGWIVVGSNNSRNGPAQLQVDAMNAMWSDVHARFATDTARSYAAGFSGGARAATAIAHACRCFAGVIAAGAGFPGGLTPANTSKLAYFGAAGNADFNYPEVTALAGELEKAGWVHRIEVFEGGHEWLPPEVALIALEWFELRAMAAGSRPRDGGFIEQAWSAAISGAQQAEQAGDRAEAHRRFAQLAADFAGLRDTSAAASRAQALASHRDVRQRHSRVRREAAEQQRIVEPLYALLAALRAAPGFDSERELRAAMLDLRARVDRERDAERKLVLRRAASAVLVGTSEEAEGAARQGDHRLAATLFQMAALLAGRPGEAYVRAAIAWAQAGEERQALAALRKAVAAGFGDRQRLESQPAFEKLRSRPDFSQILASMKP